MNRTLVIIPTYNERENLESMTERVLLSATDIDLLIVDDNSPDGTGALAEDLAWREPRVHVLHRPGKQGLGAAYQAGFSWGLERDFEVLVEMDGDGSHRPEELHRLLEALDHADLAIGSRWVDGGRVENWPLRRMVLSRAGSLYARIALGLPFHDITGGYRAFRASTLRALGLGDVASQGYCFQIDMLWHAYRMRQRIVEVPITFVERRFGVSKMDSGIVREAILRVTQWGLAALPARLLRTAGQPARPVTSELPAGEVAHVSRV
ncbi:polyprenol monophosphomannose synthase [Parafrigoribacterium soli]|uniref:polyprenol monophosphomannose synthase n=1 Tax=Parafrigoribacterium soli TaxID=3144663 RepID=UPI0032EDB36F